MTAKRTTVDSSKGVLNNTPTFSRPTIGGLHLPASSLPPPKPFHQAELFANGVCPSRWGSLAASGPR
ncbi:hypothetical protein AURDEDRAFT_163320 [Auricularia subglabra TFB-10046 SS5]|nr:hypothetical protein AURDEDRAFT_163320 [Auricularia subglabra TFB-10046 SS5]